MDIIKEVKDRITGRVATDDEELELLLDMVNVFGGGNHLEIGVLFGGTMAMVGLLLREIGGKSMVYGIDPLDGYYTGNATYGSSTDPDTGLPIDAKTCLSNLDKFDIDYFLAVTKSNPFPFTDVTFDTAFIDGDHWGDMPYIDFKHASAYTRNAIMFDNYDDGHKDVQLAVAKILAEGDWDIWKKSKIGVVLTRLQ